MPRPAEAAPLALQPLKVSIPASFKVDGKRFDYFLDKNGVDFQLDADDHGDYVEYFFANTNSFETAGRIWESLTGSKNIGKILSHDTWKRFK
jgi:hypothetical protein